MATIWADAAANYWYEDGTSTATPTFWEADSTVIPDYIFSYNVDFEEQVEPDVKRELQLQISRAWKENWWSAFSRPRPLNVLDGHHGWKSTSPIFLVSPERVVSQRYGWQ